MGRIVSIRDNPTTMTTDVEVEHVLEYIQNAVLGENPWKATVEDGITLSVGQRWRAREDATVYGEPDDLVVVSGSPASLYEVQAGRYSLTQVNNFVNAWLDKANTDGDLAGVYGFGLTAGADGLTHGKFVYQVIGPASSFIELTIPWRHWIALGRFGSATGEEFYEQTIKRGSVDSTQHRETSLNSALRSGSGPINAAINAELTDTFGELYDQAASAPPSLVALEPLVPLGLATGTVIIGLVNESIPVVALIDGSTLLSCVGFNLADGSRRNDVLDVPWDQPGPTTIRQIYVIKDTFANILKQVFCSTGTTGFNHPDHDVLPEILGLGIPYGVLTDNFFASIDRLPFSDQEATIVVERPRLLFDIFGGALILRFAFLRWKSGSLEFYNWRTPVAP